MIMLLYNVCICINVIGMDQFLEPFYSFQNHANQTYYFPKLISNLLLYRGVDFLLNPQFIYV